MLGLALLLLGSGCLSSAHLVELDGASTDGPTLSSGAQLVRGDEPLFWNGTIDEGPVHKSVVLNVPREYSAGHRFALEASIKWSDDYQGWLGVEIRDALGNVLVSARPIYYAAVAILENPSPRAYEIVVFGVQGTAYEGTVFDGVVQIEPRDPPSGPVRDLLPDLVSLPASDLQFASSGFGDTKGCHADEYVERGAERCLRFTTSVANLGQGPLEARLSLTDGLLSATGEGRWIQRVARSDGTTVEKEVGPARFHPMHEHFHYERFADYTVYSYDVAAGRRADPVGQGTKSGFCFLDMNLFELGRIGTVPPRFNGRECADPTYNPQLEWYMGISPGWYDEYDWSLADQFVEMTGVGDGTYELVVAANPAGSLLESDTSNNESSVLFRLVGDAIEVLPKAQTDG